MLVASIGESDGDSDYVKLAENSPTIPANTPYLAGHISKLEEMYKVAEGDLASPTVLFYRIDEIEILELNDAKTYPPGNHQYNGYILPVNIQPSPLQSPP